MKSYRIGVEDGLLLAALVLQENPDLRSPEGHWSITALKIACDRLREARLREHVHPFTPLFQAFP